MKQPIYLLADSGPLFAEIVPNKTLPERIADELSEHDLSAVYVGASSEDRPEFAEIFEAAFSDPRYTSKRHVTARYSAMDHMCLSHADVIVLGGGNVLRGWELMNDRGMSQVITERYLTGTILVGVSAGAVQLGMGALEDGSVVPTFRFAPFYVGVHEDDDDFPELAELLVVARETSQDAMPPSGIGIPFGSGARYEAGSLAPLRKGVVELRFVDDELRSSLLLPQADAGDGP